MKIQIHEKKIKGKTDPIFYDQIATAKAKDGSEFSVRAVGELSVIYKGEQYNEGHISEILDELNDKIINNPNPKKFEWVNNQWFEVEGITRSGEWIEIGDSFIEHDYDSAISMLKEAVRMYEKGEFT